MEDICVSIYILEKQIHFLHFNFYEHIAQELVLKINNV